MNLDIIKEVRKRKSLLPMGKEDYENFIQPKLNSIIKCIEQLNNTNLKPISDLARQLRNDSNINKSSLLDLNTTLIFVLKKDCKGNQIYNQFLNNLEFDNITKYVFITDDNSLLNVKLPSECILVLRAEITDNLIYTTIRKEVDTKYFMFISNEWRLNKNIEFINRAKNIMDTNNNIKQLILSNENDSKQLFTPSLYSSDVFCKYDNISELIKGLIINKYDMAYIDDGLFTKFK